MPRYTQHPYLLIFSIVFIAHSLLFIYVARFDHAKFADFGFPVREGTDDYQYRTLAINLASHGVFSLHSTPPFRPDVFRTPGYPAFLAVIFGITGSFFAVAFVQTILAALTGIVVYELVRTFSVRRIVACAAALLFALEPTVMNSSMRLATEILFTFLVTLSVFILFFRKESGPTFKTCFLGGLVLGLAVLVRPIGLFLPLCIPVFLFFRYRHDSIPFKHIVFAILVFWIGTGSALIPWLARNSISAGTWSISSLPAYNLLFYNTAYFLAQREHLPIATVQERLQREAGSHDTGVLTAPERIGKNFALAVAKLKDKKLSYLAFHLKKVPSFFLASGVSSILNDMPRADRWLMSRGLVSDHASSASGLFEAGRWRTVLAKSFRAPLLLLDRLFLAFTALCAAVFLYISLRQSKWRFHATLLAFLVLYFALTSIPVGGARFRVPAEPFLFSLAILGFECLRRSHTPWNRKFQ